MGVLINRLFRCSNLQGLILQGAHDNTFQFVQVQRFSHEDQPFVVGEGASGIFRTVQNHHQTGVCCECLWQHIGSPGRKTGLLCNQNPLCVLCRCVKKTTIAVHLLGVVTPVCQKS